MSWLRRWYLSNQRRGAAVIELCELRDWVLLFVCGVDHVLQLRGRTVSEYRWFFKLLLVPRRYHFCNRGQFVLGLLRRPVSIELGFVELCRLPSWDVLGHLCDALHKLRCRELPSQWKSVSLRRVRRGDLLGDRGRDGLVKLLNVLCGNLRLCDGLYYVQQLRVGHLPGVYWFRKLQLVRPGNIFELRGSILRKLLCRHFPSGLGLLGLL